MRLVDGRKGEEDSAIDSIQTDPRKTREPPGRPAGSQSFNDMLVVSGESRSESLSLFAVEE